MIILATKKGIYLQSNSNLTKISDSNTSKLSLDYNKTTLYFTDTIENAIVVVTPEGNELYRIALHYGSPIKTILHGTIANNIYVHFMDGTVRIYSIDTGGWKTFNFRRNLLQLISDPRKR